MKAIRIAIAILFLLAATFAAPMIANSVAEAAANACFEGHDC